MSRIIADISGFSEHWEKRRIYISCHAKDHDRFFPLIKKEIINAVMHCSVYHETDWSQPDDARERRLLKEELSAILSQMQVFVFPVTERFLKRKCRSRMFEFVFAVEHNIPVIPILVEPGLENMFRDSMEALRPGYGNIQYIDYTRTDFTAVQFADRFKSAMEAVLKSDGLSEKIYRSFDARMFLSYRKKDLAAAVRLMELIHGMPEFERTAIWYDEELAIGEDFNDGIVSAINDSQTVIMALTRSMTEHGNYVIEKEYPMIMAMEPARRIIPVLLEDMDMDAVMSCFPGLPEPVDIRDTASLREALLSAICVRSDVRTPEDDFLFGLACRDGIGTGRNSLKAIRYISRAAENGCENALETLGNMYYLGDAVPVDYEKGNKIFQRYSDVKRAEFIKTGDKKTRYKLMEILSKLIMGEDTAGKPDQARVYVSEIKKLAKTKEDIEYIDIKSLFMAVFYNISTDTNTEQSFINNTARAELEVLISAVGRYERMSGAESEDDVTLMLVLSYVYIGAAELYDEEFEKAYSLFMRAAGLIRRSIKEDRLNVLVFSAAYAAYMMAYFISLMMGYAHTAEDLHIWASRAAEGLRGMGEDPYWSSIAEGTLSYYEGLEKTGSELSSVINDVGTDYIRHNRSEWLNIISGCLRRSGIFGKRQTVNPLL